MLAALARLAAGHLRQRRSNCRGRQRLGDARSRRRARNGQAGDMPAMVTTDLRLNEPRYASLPNIMKAKSKPLATKTAADFGVDVAPRLETLKVVEPAKRSGRDQGRLGRRAGRTPQGTGRLSEILGMRAARYKCDARHLTAVATRRPSNLLVAGAGVSPKPPPITGAGKVHVADGAASRTEVGRGCRPHRRRSYWSNMNASPPQGPARTLAVRHRRCARDRRSPPVAASPDRAPSPRSPRPTPKIVGVGKVSS